MIKFLFSYRSIVLRALPNLKKLDNVEVTPEEVEDALRLQLDTNERQVVYEEPYVPPQPSHSQQPPHQQIQNQYRNQSPVRDVSSYLILLNNMLSVRFIWRL